MGKTQGMPNTEVLHYHLHSVWITPTPTGYAQSLILILQDGDAVGKAWARQEIIRLVKAAATLIPEAWAEEG